MALRKGIDITRESWEVLKMDRELLIFPLLSAIASAGILGTIVGAGYLIPELGRWMIGMLDKNAAHSFNEQVLGIGCLFLLYFVQWFVVIFFNSGLVGCAEIRFSGGDPTVKDGFRIAFQRLPQILAWALFTSAVGTVLSTIERKFGWFGKLVVRLVGLSWAVATYFVVPVLVVEGAGPITAVRRSVSLLKKSWGEGLSGNIVIQFVSTAVILAVIVPLGAIGIIAALLTESMIPAIAMGVLVVSILLLIVIISSALRQIFLTGLYKYANTGNVPRGFSEESMKQALNSAT